MKSRILVFAVLFMAVWAVPRKAGAWKTDTNSTTTATTVTPDKPSDILLGKTGGTNTVWISAGQTTNDWVKVSN